MKFTLGYSPCPNDCFIFDALVHKKIDTQGFDFNVQLHDVQTLNLLAQQNSLDITKLSFFAYGTVSENYILLQSGSALGFGCGPLLVQKFKVQGSKVQGSKVQASRVQGSKFKIEDSKFNIENFGLNSNSKIAIPGKNTTANFLFTLSYPQCTNKVEIVFSEIENAILNNEVDAGVIIHESRFTYQDKGLKKIIDLGEYWDALIHAPIPLGGIAMKRNFDEGTIKTVSDLIKKSVEFAFANPESCMDYVSAHAQEMSEEVMRKHIQLYVNEYSINLGNTGKNAIELLFSKAKQMGLIEKMNEKILID